MNPDRWPQSPIAEADRPLAPVHNGSQRSIDGFPSKAKEEIETDRSMYDETPDPSSVSHKQSPPLLMLLSNHRHRRILRYPDSPYVISGRTNG
jgi:hypothetical protein